MKPCRLLALLGPMGMSAFMPLLGEKHVPLFNCTSAETKPSHTMPPIRGYLPAAGKFPQTWDCVVADAVEVEPVSFPGFPAGRESREFSETRLCSGYSGVR